MAQAASTVAAWFDPNETYAQYAELASDTILAVMKDKANYKGVDLNDPAALKALAYLKKPPSYLPRPTISIPSRSNEAYFLLWAHTEAGRQLISGWEGVKPEPIFSGLEIPRFLREVLTQGTRLYKEWVLGYGLELSTRQKMALAFLSTPGRLLTQEGVLRSVQNLYADSQVQILSAEECEEVATIIRQEELASDNIFPVAEYSSEGEALHYLPFGRENKIFQGNGKENGGLETNWYDLGQVGWTPMSRPELIKLH